MFHLSLQKVTQNYTFCSSSACLLKGIKIIIKKAEYTFIETADNVIAERILEKLEKVCARAREKINEPYVKRQEEETRRKEMSRIEKEYQADLDKEAKEKTENENKFKELQDLREESPKILRDFNSKIEEAKSDVTDTAKAALTGHVDAVKEKVDDLNVRVEELKNLKLEINNIRGELNDVNRRLGKEEKKPSPEEAEDFSKPRVDILSERYGNLKEIVEENLKSIERRIEEKYALPEIVNNVDAEIEAHKNFKRNLNVGGDGLKFFRGQREEHIKNIEEDEKEVAELQKQLETTGLILENTKNALDKELKTAQEAELQEKRKTIEVKFDKFKIETAAKIANARERNGNMSVDLLLIEAKQEGFEENIKGIIKNNLEITVDNSTMKGVSVLKEELNNEAKKIDSFWTDQVTLETENKYSAKALSKLDEEGLEKVEKQFRELSANVGIAYTKNVSNNFSPLEGKIDDLKRKQEKHEKETIASLKTRCDEKRRIVQDEQNVLEKNSKELKEMGEKIQEWRVELIKNIQDQSNKAQGNGIKQEMDRIWELGNDKIKKQFGNWFTRLLPFFKGKKEKEETQKLVSLYNDVNKFWEDAKKVDINSVETLLKSCKALLVRAEEFFGNKKTVSLDRLTEMEFILEAKKSHWEELDKEETDNAKNIENTEKKQTVKQQEMDGLNKMRSELDALEKSASLSEEKISSNDISAQHKV